MRALALIDGEHYAPVVRSALEELPYEFVAAHMIGGTEKLRGDAEYGVPVFEQLHDALTVATPEVVVDLSDEPVLGPRERMRMASRVLAHGLSYVGADFRFDPPVLEPFPLPSIGIVGTGKRVGKTAITARAAQLLSRDRKLVVVSMGRGGPPEPEVAEVPPDVDALLELSRAGRHAASDYLETAALSGVPTIGCRRCGGGFAGAVSVSNVAAGAALAVELQPDLVLFDASGAALPPVETSRRVLVVNARQDHEVVTGYLNAYRHLLSDLVVLTMADEGSGWEELRDRIAELGPRVVGVTLRPRPIAADRGHGASRSSRPRATRHTRALPGTSPTSTEPTSSTSPATSPTGSALTEELERVDADVFLIELKAAAIDVVAEAAQAREIDVVLAGSDIESSGDLDLDDELLRLADEATA